MFASEGVDQYDIPHPPMYPPGRAFIYINQPTFPLPHNKLWYEYRNLSTAIQLRTWNLTTFFYPMYESGADVVLQWNCSEIKKSGYKYICLIHNGVYINMRTTSTYTFYSNPYQITYLKISFSRASRKG